MIVLKFPFEKFRMLVFICKWFAKSNRVFRKKSDLYCILLENISEKRKKRTITVLKIANLKQLTTLDTHSLYIFDFKLKPFI